MKWDLLGKPGGDAAENENERADAPRQKKNGRVRKARGDNSSPKAGRLTD